MRLGVVLAFVLVLATPVAADASTPYRSVGKILRRLDGATIRLGVRTVRVHGDTTLCAGQGPSVRRRGMRMWRRFACTYTTFTKGGVGRDIDFRAHVRSATRYAVTDAH